MMDMKLEVVVVPVSDVSEVFHHAGTAERVPGPAPGHQSFASFADPDGNGWLIQEITSRLPGR